MRRTMMAFAAMAATAAAVAADTDVVLVTRFEDGSTNAWTQADLVSALGMVNRKYHRDMGSHQGRTEWHGKLDPARCGIVTNADGRVFRRDVYADGYHFDTPFTERPVSRPLPRADASADRYANISNALAAAEARVAAGDPATVQYARDLLEANRLRRMLERENARRTTNTVSVTVTAQGGE